MFVLPQAVEDITETIDCAINIASMGEMSDSSIRSYFTFLRRRSAAHSRFYCVNRLRKDLPGGLAKWVAKRVDLDTTYNVFISHAQCPDDAQTLADRLPDNGFKVADIQITDTGTALGTHAGPGSLIIALQPAVLA